MWCYLIGANNKQNFRGLLQDGLDKFCLLYGDECTTGADRHLCMMIAWNTFCSTYAVESIATCTSKIRWGHLTSGYGNVISEESRSSVVSAIFSGLYTFVLKQIQLILERLEVQCETLLSQSSPMVPDDDVALYRFFGLSLHASIIVCKPRKWSHHRTRANSVRRRVNPFSVQERKKRSIQFHVLEHLLETDKTAIPAILKRLDRGRMTFPHRMMLPFCRSCSLLIKKSLNLPAFLKDGRKISKVSYL